jgi:hypothetical protein
VAEVSLPFTDDSADRRAASRRELPRFDLPAPDRIRIAVVWYADRIRGRDIATVCKLAIGRLTREASFAGVASRSLREVRADLPLIGVIRAAQDGAPLAQLVEEFGISWASALNVMTLTARSHPPKFRPAKTVEPLPQLRRCQSCEQLSRHESRCIICGGAW